MLPCKVANILCLPALPLVFRHLAVQVPLHEVVARFQFPAYNTGAYLLVRLITVGKPL